MAYNAPNSKEGFHFGRALSAGGMSLVLLLGQTAPLLANPTGGTVVAGSATIGAAGPTLSINQSTQNAIINWQQFSIASGETTKFIVPNSGATLNRVTGGNTSAIYGNLQSNGTLYLVNPSGIVVGPSGRIDTASFLASTLDISNQQFLSGGDLRFAGNSGASVENDGVIHASTGDVYLIANRVDNKGTLSAPQGTVGLAAGSDVLFQQAGNEHLFVQATPTGAKRALGVTNSGTIRAAAAELKAAGGNAYALAINNTGVIAATGYKKIGGNVYLTSDGGSIKNSGKISARLANGNGGHIAITGTAVASKTSGTVTNSGTLDASAKVAGGQGGTISIKNMTGSTIFTGEIVARGGLGGAGGSVEVSGGTLHFGGAVDLTATGGTTGTLLLDPATLTVVTGGAGQIVSGENDSATTIAPATIVAALNTANVVLNADTQITISNAIVWTSTSTLTLSTNTSGSTIAIGARISGVNGTLTIDTAGSGDLITDTGAVNVASFILTNGTWTQTAAALPTFSATHDFELHGYSTFIRYAGLDAANNNAEKIIDIYGLQGLGSPSGTQESVTAEVANNIDASGTATWNDGGGFKPISDYFGTLDGQGNAISGLTIDLPSSSDVGLFAFLSSEATVKNVTLNNAQITGGSVVGGLVADNGGTVSNSSLSGSVTGDGEDTFDIAGLVGENTGTITGSSNSATVNVPGGGAFNLGGLAGYNSGTIVGSFNTGNVTTGPSTDGVGGVAGFTNGGSVSGSHNTGTIIAGDNSIFVGGLEGVSIGAVASSYNTGAVTSGLTSNYVGGLEGSSGDVYYGEEGGVSGSQNSGTVTAGNGSSNVGGLVGYNYGEGAITDSFNTGTVNFNGGSTDTTPPNPPDTTTPSTATGGADGGGSNIVPPVLTTQTYQVTPPPPPPPSTDEPPFSFTGSGISSSLGQDNGGLASSSGNSGQVGSGDAAQLGGGQLNNVNNPQASGALTLALGPVVYHSLADALKDLGDWADVPDGTGTETASTNGDPETETVIGGGDVVELTKTGVKSIPRDKAPKQLLEAMNTAGLNGQ